jgi:hypothetical protein
MSSRRPLIILALILMLALGFGWTTGTVQRWVQARVVAFYVGRVAPLLPFTIESAEVNAGWRDFFAGRITALALSLKWNGYRLKMAGPISIHAGSSFELEYSSKAQLEKIGEKNAFSSEFTLSLGAKVSPTFTALQETSFLVQAPVFDWKALGVSAKNLYVGADWRDNRAEVEANAEDFGFASPESSNRAVAVTAPRMKFSLPIQSTGLASDARADFDISAKSSEVLWNELYLDLPLESLPTRGQLDFTLKRVDFQIGPSQELSLSAQQVGKDVQVHWKTQPTLNLRPVIESLIAATGSSGGPLAQIAGLKAIRVLRGTLSQEGTATALISDPTAFQIQELQAAVHDLDVDIPAAQLALREIDWRLEKSGKGFARIQKIRFRRAETMLGDTPFVFSKKIDGSWKILIGEKALPLSKTRLPVQVGAIEIESGVTEPILRTSFELGPVPLATLAYDLCVGPREVPPATARINFSKIEMTPSWFDPTGSANLDIFGGRIDATQIGIYEMGSENPEIDFNLDFDGIRLDQAGAWAGFGYMDGVFRGHAYGVELHRYQDKWVPTDYDMRFEAKPLTYSNVRFSAQAMENLVRLIASEQLEVMPGVARWFSFGWPSRFLGGYNVDFVGAKLLSHDGTILLETLDPPELFRKEGKHYILYGLRFRMPLNTDRYPVVLDAANIDSMVRGISQSIQELIDQKNQAEGKGKAHANDLSPEELSAECDPTFGSRPGAGQR